VPMSPEQRVLRARTAALVRSATEDTRLMTARARQAFNQRFVDEARASAPGGTTEAEVMRRADALRRLWFTRLSLKAANARQRASSSEGRGAKTNGGTPPKAGTR
jgi:hypothetical protein